MMYAYDEMYLNDAMNNLGEAFDYSTTVLNITMDDFLNMFIVSGIAAVSYTHLQKRKMEKMDFRFHHMLFIIQEIKIQKIYQIL